MFTSLGALVFCLLIVFNHRPSPRTYTIIHPGGLTDAPPGQRQLVITKDDAEPAGSTRVVSRADLAALVVAALASPHAVNKSFDLISMPDGEGTPTTDMDALLQEATEGL